MFPDWTWVAGFGIGAFIGSFVNVVIYRLPRGISLSNPAHSFCPSCDHRLTALDLVPLLSWLFLRGRCRHCKAKVSSRYFWVELCVASLWAIIWYQHLVVATDVLNPDRVSVSLGAAHAIAYALFAAALVAAIFTDLAHYIIPDQINAFLLFLGFGLNVALIVLREPSGWMWGVPSSLVGALFGWGVLWGIAFLGRLLFRKDAMGHGDIKMARGIGAVLLPGAAVMSFAVAIVLGAVIGVVILLVRRLRHRDGGREVLVNTIGDAQLLRLMRQLRLEKLNKNSNAAQSSLSKAESRINQLLEGSSGVTWLQRRRLQGSLSGMKELAGCFGANQDVAIFLSDDAFECRFNGDLSAWLFTLLKGFENAMKEGDLEAAAKLLGLLPDRAISVTVGEGVDRAAVEEQIETANRALDSIGIGLRTSGDRSISSVTVLADQSQKIAQAKDDSDFSFKLTVDEPMTDRGFVAAALAVIGVNVPSHLVDEPSLSGSELAKRVRSEAKARMEELDSIRTGCKEILENGEAPDFIFVESIGSLAKCGVGYLLAMDVVGLAFPKVYEWWFGENPYAYEEFEEDPVVELTMIPFGPYLAAGALIVMLAASPLWALWSRYMAFMGIE
ncbi:MAG: prepilin peptidase [Armatimonadetes bacterium]|nr:prepilin peptidase [Armatimonadota bacterium]